jgi:hypothetical protein
MKYFVSLFAGLLTGVALFMAGLYFNPFAGQPSVSPLAVTDNPVMDLGFTAVPAESILYTDHGESNIAPLPDRVNELWEPAIEDTAILVTLLEDSQGGAGIGIKYRSRSESTAVLRAEATTNSIWHVYMPGRGTFMIDQTENLWSYIRDIIIPARLSSGSSWRGTFHRITTSGPGSLGIARVTGGSGIFQGQMSESVESLTARGYSARSGPVSMEGSLTVVVPQPVVAQD